MDAKRPLEVGQESSSGKGPGKVDHQQPASPIRHDESLDRSRVAFLALALFGVHPFLNLTRKRARNCRRWDHEGWAPTTIYLTAKRPLPQHHPPTQNLHPALTENADDQRLGPGEGLGGSHGRGKENSNVVGLSSGRASLTCMRPYPQPEKRPTTGPPPNPPPLFSIGPPRAPRTATIKNSCLSLWRCRSPTCAKVTQSRSNRSAAKFPLPEG